MPFFSTHMLSLSLCFVFYLDQSTIKLGKEGWLDKEGSRGSNFEQQRRCKFYQIGLHALLKYDLITEENCSIGPFICSQSLKMPKVYLFESYDQNLLDHNSCLLKFEDYDPNWFYLYIRQHTCATRYPLCYTFLFSSSTKVQLFFYFCKKQCLIIK